jgi:FixJ family two-component response regulator
VTPLSAAPLIAIVDDDESLRVSVAGLIRSLGYRACTFDSAEAFLRSEPRASVSCVIADVRMPGMDGMALLRRLRSLGPEPPVILVTAFADQGLRRRAVAAGAYCLLEKPFEETVMADCLHGAMSGEGAWKPTPPG